ncbi:hypothetical protein S83_065840, partial [Arachis hypogaea]
SLRAEDGAYEEVQVNEVNLVHTNDGEFEFDNDFEYDSEDRMDTLLDDNKKDNNDDENQNNIFTFTYRAHRKYQFVPLDLHWARKNFEKRGAILLKNLLGKARASRVKHQWIGEVVWDAFCAYWNTDVGFLQKSAQGNGFGAALHTTGSISVIQHKANMKKSLKKTPTQLELFTKTHKHKYETWVDKKSKHVEYCHWIAKDYLFAFSSNSCLVSQISILDIKGVIPICDCDPFSYRVQ